MQIYFRFFIFLCFVITACKPSFEEPNISLESYKIEEGFDLKVIASEPLLEAPVAIDFDTKGRIWVAEMTGFMRDLDGKGEDAPTGSIKILEDLDGDGVMDHQKQFLKGLVMPRALALVYGGLLYVEPPNLWFVDIEKDKPVRRVLVDSLYAPEGNPEHQPNGLKLNIDNWIYSANSNFRYQLKKGVWIKESTSFRGQWGISHDNFGRLYANSNSVQILGDYVLPNRHIRNKYYKPTASVYQTLTNNQRVYPLHAASVNRGYAEGQLTKDSLLINVTSSCGPEIYRGGLFPDNYNQNAFVCVPEANLIKRNRLSFNGDQVKATQAWDDKEFLASTDEGFRPVNLSNSPDGSLYIVDMHRGVIQHHAFLSPYLRERSKAKNLDTMLNFGRILKVENKNKPGTNVPNFNTLSGSELVELLKHDNGWIRDRAQHHLIYKNKTEVIPLLKELVGTPDTPWTQIHALYTLKGMEAISVQLLTEVARNSNAEVASHAVALLDDFIADENTLVISALFTELIHKNNLSIDLYVSASIGLWVNQFESYFQPIMNQLINRYGNNPVFNDAFLSGFGDFSEAQLLHVKQQINGEGQLIKGIEQTLDNRKRNKKNYIFSEKPRTSDTRTKGAKLFRQLCAVCHGVGGEGIEGLAPPLMESEYISNPKGLGLIMLHGLKGPVHVNGILYQMNIAMPGFAHNTAVSDTDVIDIIAYVTSAFSDVPQKLKHEDIKALRNNLPAGGSEYTEEALQDYLKTLK